MPFAELIEAARAAERERLWESALGRYEDALRQLPSCGGGAREAVEVFRWIGNVHRQRGEIELALEAYELSLEVAERSELRDCIPSALNGLGAAQLQVGRTAEAKELYLRARALAEELGLERTLAMIEQNLAVVESIRGEVAAALKWSNAALEIHQRLGDHLAAAQVLNNLGMAHVDLREWGAAERCFDRAFRLADQMQATTLLGLVELNRTELYLHCREFDRARECCDRSFEIFGRSGASPGLADTYKFYGCLYRETGKPVLAHTNLGAAVELAQQCQSPLHEAEALREWALVHQAEERNREALRCLNRAHRIFGEMHARRDLLDLDRRLDQLEGTYLKVVRAWGESIEWKDRYTAGHCARVADYACLLAEAVGFRGRDLMWFRMGAYLLDVGNTAVHADVLNKPGKLNSLEWKLMQRHTTEGDLIVAELNFPWDIRPMVRSHHERWDGRGYPDRLQGEEIPLTARIVSLADVYDALTTQRPYRAAYSPEEALRMMEGDVGAVFDPVLFPVFRELIERGSAPADTPRLFCARAA